MTMINTEDYPESIVEPRKCESCVHIQVCVIFRSISSFFDSFVSFSNKLPIEPMSLAAICELYMPIVGTKVLRKLK